MYEYIHGAPHRHMLGMVHSFVVLRKLGVLWKEELERLLCGVSSGHNAVLSSMTCSPDWMVRVSNVFVEIQFLISVDLAESGGERPWKLSYRTTYRRSGSPRRSHRRKP